MSVPSEGYHLLTGESPVMVKADPMDYGFGVKPTKYIFSEGFSYLKNSKLDRSMDAEDRARVALSIFLLPLQRYGLIHKLLNYNSNGVRKLG